MTVICYCFSLFFCQPLFKMKKHCRIVAYQPENDMGYDKNVLIIIMNTNKVRFSETLKLLLASCIGIIPDVLTMLSTVL